PGECSARVLAAADVERPVDDDVELEARPGPELEQSDATLDPVPERHQADTGSLLEPPNAARELLARIPPTVELRHASSRAPVGEGQGPRRRRPSPRRRRRRSER